MSAVESRIQSEDDQAIAPKEWNERLQELVSTAQTVSAAESWQYRIGPEDLILITVFEVPELTRDVRVSANGEISMPLLGAVKASGLSPQELERVLQELLRRTYMKDPQVSVFVREMQSHPVSVFGAVRKPGVFQIRGARTLIEVLSLAEGLEEDAGDTVIVMRKPPHAGPAYGAGSREIAEESGYDTLAVSDEAGTFPSRVDGTAQAENIEIDLKVLLESPDSRHNILVYPGDFVKVTRAGIVYVVGEVNKPGGFVLQTNENISVLQALALAEGHTGTAAKSKARIIRTDQQTGERVEIPLDLEKVLEGKSEDALLQPKDILFVPNSASRTALYRAAETAISIVSGVIIWRR